MDREIDLTVQQCLVQRSSEEALATDLGEGPVTDPVALRADRLELHPKVSMGLQLGGHLTALDLCEARCASAEE